MDTDNVVLETLTNNEIITCLWNKNATEKCRVGLADVVIYEGGNPSRWYVTGKTGDITKKRGADLQAISQRWLKIYSQSDSPAVAIIRQDGGILKFLSLEAWNTLISDEVNDPSVQSLHCFINGENHCVYRNSFTLRDKLGRYTSQTHSYGFQLDRNSSSSVTTMYTSQINLVESKANQIRNILDLATNTVVRYMELMLKVKIVTLCLDFVIDKKSQIWLLWASDAKFVRVADLSELSSLPRSLSDTKVGRMSWAGPHYVEEVMAGDKSSSASGKGRRGVDSPGRDKLMPLPSSPSAAGRSSRQSFALDTASQSSMNSESTPSAVRAERELTSVQINLAATAGRGASDNAKAAGPLYSLQVDPTAGPHSSFPQPFSCKGDYCKFLTQLNGSSGGAGDEQKRLFSEKELIQLGRDKGARNMLSFAKRGGEDGAELFAISMKSLVLARQERRGLTAQDSGSQPWSAYPVSPRTNSAFAADSTVSGGMSVESGTLQASHQRQVESVLAHDKQQRETFTKAVATYYEQVRVCAACRGIYQCLDWARDVLGRGDAYGAGAEGMGAAFPAKDKTKKRDRSKLVAAAVINSDGEESNVILHSQTMSALPSYASATAASTASQSSVRKEHKEQDSRARATSPSAPKSPPQGSRRKPTAESDTDFRKSWKDHLPRKVPDKARSGPVDGTKFVGLDDYLRGGAEALAARKSQERERIYNATHGGVDGGQSQLSVDSFRTATEGEVYHGQVLLACDDPAVSFEIRKILEEALFQVHCAADGRQAVNDFVLKDKGFDCVLVQRDLPLNDAFKVTAGVREFERLMRKKAAALANSLGQGVQPPTRRHPVVCVTEQTSPADLKAYMLADMDGCVSLPVNRASLLSTMRASVPHHLAQISTPQANAELLAAKTNTQVYRLGSLGELEGSNDSSTMAAKTLPIAGGGDDDVAFNGIVQIDADTRVPFTVMDASRSAKVLVNPSKPFFNLVVCHDLFDTAERMKIFLRPMVQRYLGMQVLLWNYPGQAFTEWREEQLLNNEYLATCLNEVLGQVGEKGTRDFDTTRPFYVMGYGTGVSVASFYAAHYRVPNLRGLLNVNGWSFLDSYLAGVMHDCINIFQCSPSSRPDLPVYFFSRFVFSKDYLAKVSVPLALNIYTAVHNSISIKGRLALCKGVLKLVDVRPLLREIDCPIICVHSTQDALVRPMHAEPFATHRGGEVRSIYKVLQSPHKTCVVWMNGGHEVFQENKKQTQLLIEQILTGFHETHDISFPSGPAVDAASTAQGRLVSSLPWENAPGAGGSRAHSRDGGEGRTVEDKFIDNVLGSMSKLGGDSAGAAGQSATLPPSSPLSGPSGNKRQQQGKSGSGLEVEKSQPVGNGSTVSFASADPSAWQKYSETLSENQVLNRSSTDSLGKLKKGSLEGGMTRIIDPTSTNFERLQPAAGQQQNAQEYPEVKEFMSWRLKRNKKRLQRLQGAARIIQGAFRAYIARNFVHGIRRLKAALFIQRVFRGWRGRYAFQKRARRIWAVQIMQRSWRGYVGRKWYFLTRLRIVAAANIQRMFRGHRARIFVNKLKRKRFVAASLIQAMGRRYIARKDAWRRRQFRNCATSIQRIFRGFLGRNRAIAERNKYIFSRSQSQGIEFGRQMLLEHKLHATRLQSDVTLLTQEKVGAEEQIEALLEEISSFEEGVRTLEREMHQLSKVESEAAAFMDEDSKFELREQKIKLDREFGEMLGKIGARKDSLGDLERKLSTIDKSRQAKEEELRTLERKLVVLLEEQQNELNAIKRKQDVRGAMLAASHEELMKVTGGGGSSDGASTQRQVVSRSGGGGGGGSGPSLQEKKQAAQLMQSTETLMKFGFMSMSMTYFSSLNMIKALRTVSAQDTVMAALADVHAQRAVGFGAAGGGGGGADHGGESASKANFLPDLRPGQLSGQQVLKVSAWSVDDVAKWLRTLSLGQYSEAFIDSAVDGEFLYDLNDDDLKNTLGIEHRLHRKKILGCVHRLKVAEAQRDTRLNDLLREGGGLEAPVLAPDADPQSQFSNPFANGEGGNGDDDDRAHIDGPKIPLAELFSLVRHSKFSLLKEAVDYMPNKPFDSSLVQAGYVSDHGTVYLSGYERLPFHLNKVDEFGNTMLSLACQNGNAKICKYLLAKGANPNHQNKTGQTPAHFAIAYKFFDLSNWLFENGASDLIENKFGLSPYDGLSAEGGDELLAIDS